MAGTYERCRKQESVEESHKMGERNALVVYTLERVRPGLPRPYDSKEVGVEGDKFLGSPASASLKRRLLARRNTHTN